MKLNEKNNNQQQVWNALAGQWYLFRKRPWPDVEKVIQMLAKWKPGKILDIGCGNCRNLLPFAGFRCYGIDFSDEMLKQATKFCKQNGIKVTLKHAEASKLPFTSQSFDYCLSIALLHHLEAEKQKAALFEMFRVLKPRGKALITVWNKLQPRFIFKPKDLYIPWKVNGKSYKRYYHLFTYWELKKLLKECCLEILYNSGIFGRNLIFVAQKW